MRGVLPQFWAIGIIACELCLVIAILWHFSTPGAIPGNDPAEAWLIAVQTNNADLALALSSQLSAPNPVVPEKLSAYAHFLGEEGVRPGYLRTPPTEADFREWREAWFFKRLADRVVRGDPGNDELAALFLAVTTRLKVPSSHLFRPAADGSSLSWPQDVWRRGTACCDGMTWVLAALAYQRGWEVQVVYLFRPGESLSCHTLLECRRQGRACILDPLSRLYLPGLSVDRLAASPHVLAGIWEDHPDYRQAIRHCLLFTPAMPGDYAPRNQNLHATLRARLGPASPRFGEDPERRMQRYWQLRAPELTDAGLFPMQLWYAPIRCLAWDQSRARNRSLSSAMIGW